MYSRRRWPPTITFFYFEGVSQCIFLHPLMTFINTMSVRAHSGDCNIQIDQRHKMYNTSTEDAIRFPESWIVNSALMTR
jgi:hypothetical protein